MVLQPRPRISSDYDCLSGMSDQSVAEKTGRGWAEWVEKLDAHGAASMSHGDIASLVHTKYGVSGWWSQAVTVGYERIKGIRAIGQRRDGTFEASKSKTIAAAASAVHRALTDAQFRRRWLRGTGLTLRNANAKTVRLDAPDGSIVQLHVTPAGRGKTQVSIQHAKLADRKSVDAKKELWSERLAALAALLEPTRKTATKKRKST